MDITQSIPDAKWNNRILPAFKAAVGTDDEQVVIDHLKLILKDHIKKVVKSQEINKAVRDAKVSEIDV